MVHSSCFTFIQINVTKPRLDGKIVLSFLLMRFINSIVIGYIGNLTKIMVA